MKRRSVFARFFLLFLVLLFLCGCENTPPLPEELPVLPKKLEPFAYQISLHLQEEPFQRKDVYFNAAGKIVTGWVGAGILYDEVTGKQVGYESFFLYEEEQPIDTNQDLYTRKPFSALYRADGTQALNWKAVHYWPIFGNFVLAHAYGQTAGSSEYLVSMHSGKTVFSDVSNLEQIDENYALLQKQDGTTFFAINRRGRKLAEIVFDEPYHFAGTFGENLLFEKDGPLREIEHVGLLLLNKKLEVIGETPRYIATDDPQGKCFFYVKNDIYYLYHLDRGVLYAGEENESFSYCDGEVLIGSKDRDSSFLSTLDGTVLLKSNGEIRKITSGKWAGNFLCFENRKIFLKDRTGTILRETQFDDLSHIIGFENGEMLFVQKELVPSNDEIYVIALDADLNERISGDKYIGIHLLRQDGPLETRVPLISCGFYDEIADVYLYDLYDTQWNLLLNNIQRIGTVGEDALAIQRGNFYGIIDFEGNWIKKYALYEDVLID